MKERSVYVSCLGNRDPDLVIGAQLYIRHCLVHKWTLLDSLNKGFIRPHSYCVRPAKCVVKLGG
jgi:hypothetical protein